MLCCCRTKHVRTDKYHIVVSSTVPGTGTTAIITTWYGIPVLSCIIYNNKIKIQQPPCQHLISQILSTVLNNLRSTIIIYEYNVLYAKLTTNIISSRLCIKVVE